MVLWSNIQTNTDKFFITFNIFTETEKKVLGDFHGFGEANLIQTIRG